MVCLTPDLPCSVLRLRHATEVRLRRVGRSLLSDAPIAYRKCIALTPLSMQGFGGISPASSSAFGQPAAAGFGVRFSEAHDLFVTMSRNRYPAFMQRVPAGIRVWCTDGERLWLYVWAVQSCIRRCASSQRVLTHSLTLHITDREPSLIAMHDGHDHVVHT